MHHQWLGLCENNECYEDVKEEMQPEFELCIQIENADERTQCLFNAREALSVMLESCQPSTCE